MRINLSVIFKVQIFIFNLKSQNFCVLYPKKLSTLVCVLCTCKIQITHPRYASLFVCPMTGQDNLNQILLCFGLLLMFILFLTGLNLGTEFSDWSPLVKNWGFRSTWYIWVTEASKRALLGFGASKVSMLLLTSEELEAELDEHAEELLILFIGDCSLPGVMFWEARPLLRSEHVAWLFPSRLWIACIDSIK